MSEFQNSAKLGVEEYYYYLRAVNFAAAQRRLGMTRTKMETLIGAGRLTPGA